MAKPLPTESAAARELRDAIADARATLETMESGHQDDFRPDDVDELQHELALTDLHTALRKAERAFDE